MAFQGQWGPYHNDWTSGSSNQGQVWARAARIALICAPPGLSASPIDQPGNGARQARSRPRPRCSLDKGWAARSHSGSVPAPMLEEPRALSCHFGSTATAELAMIPRALQCPPPPNPWMSLLRIGQPALRVISRSFAERWTRTGDCREVFNDGPASILSNFLSLSFLSSHKPI